MNPLIWCRLLRARYLRDIRAPLRLAMAAPSGSASTAEIARAQSLAIQVQAAARYLPGSRCLDRALTLFALCRQDGLPARIRLGIRRPVGRRAEAHAWVEVGAIAIGEDPAQLAHLLPLAPEDAGPSRFD